MIGAAGKRCERLAAAADARSHPLPRKARGCSPTATPSATSILFLTANTSALACSAALPTIGTMMVVRKGMGTLSCGGGGGGGASSWRAGGRGARSHGPRPWGNGAAWAARQWPGAQRNQAGTTAQNAHALVCPPPPPSGPPPPHLHAGLVDHRHHRVRQEADEDRHHAQPEQRPPQRQHALLLLLLLHPRRRQARHGRARRARHEALAVVPAAAEAAAVGRGHLEEHVPGSLGGAAACAVERRHLNLGPRGRSRRGARVGVRSARDASADGAAAVGVGLAGTGAAGLAGRLAGQQVSLVQEPAGRWAGLGGGLRWARHWLPTSKPPRLRAARDASRVASRLSRATLQPRTAARALVRGRGSALVRDELEHQKGGVADQHQQRLKPVCVGGGTDQSMLLPDGDGVHTHILNAVGPAWLAAPPARKPGPLQCKGCCCPSAASARLAPPAERDLGVLAHAVLRGGGKQRRQRDAHHWRKAARWEWRRQVQRLDTRAWLWCPAPRALTAPQVLNWRPLTPPQPYHNQTRTRPVISQEAGARRSPLPQPPARPPAHP